jgi:hypothetical protein
MIATFLCFISAPVDSMVGFVRHITRSGGPPARSIARRITSTVSPMQRLARGCGLITIAFLPLTAISALKIAVEVGLVVGMTPATTPTGVATSITPFLSSRATMPTVFSSLIEAQVPSAPNKFLRIL